MATNRTILLVDDDESVLRFLSNSLRRTGFHVLCAADAEQAIRISREYEKQIDLLVSDIQMSPGLSGIELAIRLPQERPGIKVLLMSGTSVERSDLKKGWDFIQKPFPVETFQRDVRNLLVGDVPGDVPAKYGGAEADRR